MTAALGAFYIQLDDEKHTLDHICEALVLARRTIVSSNGASNIRYIIQTQVAIAGQTWPIEVSLNNRGSMKRPMLIGH